MPKVTFVNNGESSDATVNQPLKEITKTSGWPIAYGCEDGVCGTCIVRITAGKENLNDMEETEQQTLEIMGMNDCEHRLCCQCRVKDGEVSIEGM